MTWPFSAALRAIYCSCSKNLFQTLVSFSIGIYGICPILGGTLRREVKHPLQGSKLAIDGGVSISFFHPILDVGLDTRCGDLGHS